MSIRLPSTIMLLSACTLLLASNTYFNVKVADVLYFVIEQAYEEPLQFFFGPVSLAQILINEINLL
jgi:hypothetical protein